MDNNLTELPTSSTLYSVISQDPPAVGLGQEWVITQSPVKLFIRNCQRLHYHYHKSISVLSCSGSCHGSQDTEISSER